MAVVQPDYDSAPRGNTDAARHREKVHEAIRRNLPDILSDEAIITQREKRVVKVPIRGVKSYHFIHGQVGGSGGGFGSGDGKKGRVLGQRPKPEAGQPGQPGGEPGVDYLETEIDIEELIQMMLEDLGLPNLRRKEVREAVVPKGWTYDSLEKHGIRPRLDKLRSVKEAIKRTEVLVAWLMGESGRPEAECRAALQRADGDVREALALLAASQPAGAADSTAVPFPPADPALTPSLENADLRYRTLKQDVEFQSNAVIVAMMDVSGSMDTMKKYFARSFFFWMLSFLRTIYKHVEIRFIAHTTEAKLVDEHEFFHKGESGGTNCHSAYDLAGELIDSEYPTSRWNVYPFHFSDGEDWDADRTVQSLKSLLERGVSAFGYGEIQTDYSSSVLMSAFEKELALQESRQGQLIYYEGEWRESPVLGVILHRREDLYPALRVFLHPEREKAP